MLLNTEIEGKKWNPNPKTHIQSIILNELLKRMIPRDQDPMIKEDPKS